MASGSQRLSGFYANNSLNLNRTGEVTVKFYSDGSRNDQGFLADVYGTVIKQSDSHNSNALLIKLLVYNRSVVMHTNIIKTSNKPCTCRYCTSTLTI